MEEVTKVLPAIALRGTTILPDMIVHFDISRPKSVRAVEEAMLGDQKIFLITQKDPDTEVPGLLDVYKIGTKEERIEKVLEMAKIVGLNADAMNRYPHEFSGGQRQRIVIARALILNPEFIVCDEPVSALDVSIRSQVLNLIHDIQKKYNLSYLFISHDLSVVKHISDRVAVMYLGRIVEYGKADDVIKNPKHPYTRALISAAPIADPHLAKEKKRIILKGEVPSPLNPPVGCPFAGRCRYASESCRQKKPEIYEYDNRKVACNLYSPENLAKYKAVGKTPEQILAE